MQSLSSEIGIKSTVTLKACAGSNGGSCIQSSLERTATRNWVSVAEWDKRGHNSGMTPVNWGRRNRRAHEGSYQGGNASGSYSPVGLSTTDLSVAFRGCLSVGGAQGKRPPCYLPSDITRPFGFLEFIRMFCRSPQPNGRSVATEWARKGKREHPGIEHWRSEPRLKTKQIGENSAEHGWNSSRISPCSCWLSLTSLISDAEADLLWETPMMMCGASSVHRPRDWMELQDGNWWPECLLVKQHGLLRLVALLFTRWLIW